MRFKWLPRYEKHCRKHQRESPEISPEHIEQVMASGQPSRVYADKTGEHRLVFEGYYPPRTGRPYRVIFEVSDDGEVIPVACWRIKDKDFGKVRGHR